MVEHLSNLYQILNKKYGTYSSVYMNVSPVDLGGYFGKDLITPFPVKSVEDNLSYSLSWVLYPQLVLFYKLSFRLGILLNGRALA